jgi:hypothetical protein
MAGLTTFLLELYVPQADYTAATLSLARLTCAATKLTAEGRAIRVMRTIFVPEDETCYVLVQAATVHAVQDAAKRASLPFERVVATTL